MNLLLLTTQTPHHTFFVEKIKSFIDNIFVICEKNKTKAQCFDDPFFKARERFEINSWFSGKKKKIDQLANTFHLQDINTSECKNLIKSLDFDISICFGTSIIKKEILNIFNKNIYNLHGGDPERYRGLDSHLWSLYHNDLNGLFTTLHVLSEKVDDGNIVKKKKINIKKVPSLQSLQMVNTEICLELSKSLIFEYREKKIIEKKQINKSRYYSFLPKVLLPICNKNFETLKK